MADNPEDDDLPDLPGYTKEELRKSISAPTQGATQGIQPPSSNPLSQLYHKAKTGIDSFITKHLDELAQKKEGILNPNPEQNPLIDKPVFPEMKPAPNEGFLDTGIRGVYNNVLRPMTSLTGLIGMGLGHDIPKEPIGLANEANIKPPNTPPPAGPAIQPPKMRLELPPTKAPSFIAGDAGVALNEPYKLPSGATIPPEIAASGNVGPRPAPPQGTVANLGEILEKQRIASLQGSAGWNGMASVPGRPSSPLPAQSGSTALGFNPQTTSSKPLPYPLNVVPDMVRPRVAQTQGMALAPEAVQRGLPEITPPKNFVSPETPPIEPPAKPMIGDTEVTEAPTTEPYQMQKPVGKYAQKSPLAELPKVEPETEPEPEAPEYSKDAKSAKQATKEWAWKRNAASIHGDQAAEQFQDLADKPELIAAYQKGDRSGRLADVQKYLDDLHAQEVKAGILDEDSKKANYLRQYWDNTPEEIDKAFAKTRIAKTPGFAKQSVFSSYAQGIAAGLTPAEDKAADIPSIIGARVAESKNALANKAFYDYLNETGQIKKGALIQSPDTWKSTFRGANSKQLNTDIDNYFSKSPEGLKVAADTVSLGKNLALGTGVGNISPHGMNIARSDVMARGVKAGLGDYFAGTFNPAKDVADIAANKKLIPELVEHGFQWSNIEDHNPNTGGVRPNLPDAVNKGLDIHQKLFEDPTFKVALPAAKLRLASDTLNRLLESGMDRKEALTRAAEQANDFMGGVDKSLRNKTYQDLMRIGLLAPDWLESRMNLATKGVKALVGKQDPIYAKALGRRVAMGAIKPTIGIGAILAGAKTNNEDTANLKPAEAPRVPMGTDALGKRRTLNVMGTAAEDVRQPMEVVAGKDIGKVATSKISGAARAAHNLLFNQDDFGNSIRGNDKYGKPIPLGTSLAKNANELIRPIEPPLAKALADYLSGNVSAEEGLVKGLGLPFDYNKPDTVKTSSSRRPPHIRFER